MVRRGLVARQGTGGDLDRRFLDSAALVDERRLPAAAPVGGERHRDRPAAGADAGGGAIHRRRRARIRYRPACHTTRTRRISTVEASAEGGRPTRNRARWGKRR